MGDAVETAVRTAFAEQAGWCRQLGSPLNGLICALVGERLDRESAIGRRILDWPGRPAAKDDALPLRLTGGLHALVRRGALPALARHYPPHPLPEAEPLWAALREALHDAGKLLDPWLDSAPQTNEVARSAILMAGHLTIAHRTGLPVSLFEIGASAGLNLVLDRYAYQLGTVASGRPGSALRLVPEWQGGEPPAAAVTIPSRRGVDLNPMRVADPEDRERLLAYIWPDQAERLARIAAAITLAAEDPPAIDREDAAPWIERQVTVNAAPGLVRVVQNSIAFQYFAAETQHRIRTHLERVGVAATAETPLAWLQFEIGPIPSEPPLLTLRLWPGDGRPETLASASAHGQWVQWRGAEWVSSGNDTG